MRLQTFTPERARAVERRASLLCFVYLLATLPALVWPGVAGRSWPLTALHLVGLAWLGWSVRAPEGPGPVVTFLADWAPLALVPFFYAEIPHIAPFAGYHDATIQRLEADLFSFQPAHLLAGDAPWLWLSELLHGAYFSYYALIFVPPALLWFRGRRDEFGRTALAVMGAFVACYVAFILFPVEGPRYAWSAPPGAPDGPIRRLVLALLAGGSARGTAFPSSHAAVAVASSCAALRFQRRVGVVVSVLTVLLLVGAVYGGFHYAVDMLAGTAVGLGVAVVVLRRVTVQEVQPLL